MPVGRVWSDVSMAQTDESTPQRRLRVWPGVVAVVLLWFVRYALPKIVPEAMLVGVFGELVGAVAVPAEINCREHHRREGLVGFDADVLGVRK